MKSIHYFIFSLVFAGLLLGQNPSEFSTSDNGIDQHRSFRDRWNKFKRDRSHNTVKNALDRYAQSPKPIYKITGNGVDTAWIQYYASGNFSNSDEAVKIATDNMGNVIVSGCSDSSFTGTDYVTVKFDSTGAQQWVARYSSNDHWDVVASMKVDTLGDIFVTGSGGTVKYNTTGQLLWTVEGDGNSLDVDAKGNTYVGGASGITKILPSGDVVWRVDTAYCSSITVDQVGSVYITKTDHLAIDGYSYSFIKSSKYNENGKHLWTSAYYGLPTSKSYPVGIHTDIVGNVYVMGTCIAPGGYYYLADYVTIKYDSTGIEQWVRKYNGPGNGADFATASSIDKFGNIYITGSSVGLQGVGQYYADYATIKYDSAGIQQWTARYNGLSNFDDAPEEVTTDYSGNVYVTGRGDWSCTTVKYDGSGQELWAVQKKITVNGWDVGISIAVDKSGNVCIAANSDYTTIKYNSAGIQQWIRTYRGPGSSRESLNAFTVDGNGNAYAAGVTHDFDNDYLLIKYNSFGSLQWVATYGNKNNTSDEATSLVVDKSGNIYVTGKNDSNCITIKFDPSGNQLWIAEIQGDFKYKFPSIFLHPNGNVYVLETSGIVAYDTQGNKVLQKNISVTTFTFDQKGNLFIVSSESTEGHPFGLTYLVVTKYDPSGNFKWSGKIDSVYYHESYSSTAVKADSAGNVFITGSFEDEMSSSQLFVSKFDSSGSFQWLTAYSDSTFGNLEGSAIGITNNGNICVTGVKNSYTNIKYVTLFYDGAGVLRWSKEIGGIDLSIDRMDNVYVCGATGTTKFSGNGDLQWSIPLASRHIVLDDKGSIFLSNTISWDVGSGIMIAKLQQTPTLVNITAFGFPSSFVLFQNFPNPFNPVTTIRYALPSTAHVTLTIHDLLGREIATLVNEEQSVGWNEVEWNASGFASGVYFVKMISDNFTGAKKILLMK